jgi:tocopherol O-methyltransferase
MFHFGYYPNGSEGELSHEEALIETVRQVALRLKPEPGQLLMDAGCGIGGPAVWLARNYDVRVDGVTIVPEQVSSAANYAKSCDLDDASLVRFFELDYANTGFALGSYDGVFAIESVCYAEETVEFLKEAHRLLKPGGRLVVLDAFRTKRDIGMADEELMKSWLSGWGAQDIDTTAEFCDKAEQCGFIDVQFEDLQKHFQPSHHRAYEAGRLLSPVVGPLNRLGLVSDTTYGHIRASRDAWIAANRGLCVQGVISACKLFTNN